MLILPFVDVWIYITHTQNQIHIKSHACTTLWNLVSGLESQLLSPISALKKTYSETKFFLLLEVLSLFFFLFTLMLASSPDSKH